MPDVWEKYELNLGEIERLNVEYKRLDGRQVAIKEWMNSIYGLTGDTNNTYCKKEIATTITGTGRWMINFVRIEIEKKYCRKNGYPFDAKIIYGDTDSVFIWLQGFGHCMPSAFSIGQIMADYINTLFAHLSPAKFAFEKIYDKLTLISAKFYFGHKWMPAAEGN